MMLWDCSHSAGGKTYQEFRSTGVHFPVQSIKQTLTAREKLLGFWRPQFKFMLRWWNKTYSWHFLLPSFSVCKIPPGPTWEAGFAQESKEKGFSSKTGLFKRKLSFPGNTKPFNSRAWLTSLSKNKRIRSLRIQCSRSPFLDLEFAFSPGEQLDHEASEQQLAASCPGRNAENISYREVCQHSLLALACCVFQWHSCCTFPCIYESDQKSLCQCWAQSWSALTWGLCTSVHHWVQRRGKTLCLQEGKARSVGLKHCWKKAIMPAQASITQQGWLRWTQQWKRDLSWH